MTAPPLDGLRVLELATGVAGPYAGRLLAMLGATVAKVEPPGGDPLRRQPVDDGPVGPISPAYIHLNAGKLSIRADAADLAWPHVIIDSRLRADLVGTSLDPAGLDPTSGPKLVSVTAWGIDADTAGEVADELLVQAASGILGFNGDPGGPPLRLAGWQSQYLAGGCAAAGAMAALRLDVAHVEVSWLGALLTGVELTYADALHCDRRRPLPGPHPPNAYPSGAIPCSDGFVAPGSIRAVDWEMQCLLYGLPELVDDPSYSDRHRRAGHVAELWDHIRPWYAARTKREMFQLALDTPWAVGMVMTPSDALTDEHLLERGFLGPVRTAHGVVRAPIRPVRMAGLPVPGQAVSEPAADELVPAGPRPARSLRRLDGLRLIEMTVAWAGPFVGNFLAPLGVDVVKIEAQAPFDGWRALRPYDHGMPPGLEHLVDDNRWFEASGLFNALNKGKRGCVVDLSAHGGQKVLLDLVASADALVSNFSAHVLPSLGLDWESLSAVNPGLVVVRMPAFGVEGPYAGAAGYGSILEAMSGLGHRQGYEHEDARISNIYFPDPAAGMHATVALLAGLDRRDRTGEGGEIDLSHQEVTWLGSGEALVLADRSGRDIDRLGNREPGRPDVTIRPEGEGWVATTGVATEPVTDPWTAPHGPRLADWIHPLDHPVTGPVRQIAHPLRLDGVRPVAARHAPLFDADTDAVLAEVAGYDDARLAALRAAGAIGGELPPPADLGYRF